MPPVRRAQINNENESALTQNAMVGKLNNLTRNKFFQQSVSNFRLGDKDMSNSINLEEFNKMAKKMPLLRGKSENTLGEIFRKIDQDCSGGLNISEFHTF